MKAMLAGVALLAAGCGSDASPQDGSPYPSFAGCTFGDSVPASEIAISPPLSYAPACVRLRAGGSVTIQANAMHPLQGMTRNGSTPNPITEGEPSTGWLQDRSFTFPTPGAYGYVCNVHGSDTTKAGTMTGVVYVEP